ncbi:hypothetical protein NDN08_000231 [Rhodosorus marinus]|uniref:Glycosyl transferase CAP10 domain-containing protein n=1 Tax=Rhodosorus marinus TaxID=101924 RepID=A0AAV8UEN4_9RHOD|nr:hypothetical protein NDN08_000231 [Rhodosorus marinus]
MEIFGVRLRRHERFQLDGVNDDTSSDEGYGVDAEDPEVRSLWNWQHVDGHGSGSRGRHKAHKKSRLRTWCQGAVDLVKRNKGFVILLVLVFYYVFGICSRARLPDTRQPADERTRSDLTPREGSLSAGGNNHNFVEPPPPPRSGDVETGLHQNQKPEVEEKPQDQQEKKPFQNHGQPPALHPEVEERKQDHGHDYDHGHAPDLLHGLKLAGASAESEGDTVKSPFSNEDTGLWVAPSNAGAFSDESVRTSYEKLVQRYLAPFAKEGIPRTKLIEILNRRTYGESPDGANKGKQSVLFQIRDDRIHLYDPNNFLNEAKPFHLNRIHELIFLLSNLAKVSRLPDTEFLVSIHDCVQTVSKETTYRVARYVESNPGFTIVSCNFSDNIPIPMWEGDTSRGGGYRSWDSNMAEYAKDDIPWLSKESKAVFRGGMRPSSFYRNRTEAEINCRTTGRSVLLEKSAQRPDIFDVSLAGSCEGTKYTLNRMEPRDHHRFKYVLYAEGNCFWADRINRQLFGPSAIIKQETPCGQFFEPLLHPGVHYLPADFYFTNLETTIDKIKNDDKRAQEIVRNANNFAKSFLSLEGISIYMEELLKHYSKLLVSKEVAIEEGAQDVTMDTG